MVNMKNATEAMQAWRAGNDAGDGYAPEPEAGVPTVRYAVCELLADTASRLRLDLCDDEIMVVQCGDGSLVGICDANGAWAVKLDSWIIP